MTDEELVNNFLSTVPPKSKYVVPDYKIDPDEARAVKAYIIELREALAEFVKLQEPANPQGNAGFYSIPFARIAKARAAIAKAKGER